MKSLLLSLALGAGALGVVAISPAEAKAFRPMGMGMGMGMFGFRGFGSRNVQLFGTPTVTSTMNGSNTMLTINMPSGVRSRLTPNGVAQMFFGPRSETINFNNSTGVETVSKSSLATQFVFTPYSNISRPFFRLGNNVLVNPISLGLSSGIGFTFAGPINTMGGSMFSVPFTNFGMATGLSSLFSMTHAGTMGLFSLTASGEPESETAAAYRDYVPPGYIK